MYFVREYKEGEVDVLREVRSKSVELVRARRLLWIRKPSEKGAVVRLGRYTNIARTQEEVYKGTIVD